MQGQAWVVSGPMWIGQLHNSHTIDAMLKEASLAKPHIAKTSQQLLQRLRKDTGFTPRSWPAGLIAKQLRLSPQPLDRLVDALVKNGYRSSVSGIMAGQLRSEAPWAVILTTAAKLARGGSHAAR